MVDYGHFFLDVSKKILIMIIRQRDEPGATITRQRGNLIMARKTIKTSPVKTSTAVAGTGKVTLTFEIDVNSLTLAPGGDYFNLPYLVNGAMIHGKTEVPAFISKGRVILPTAQGRAKRGHGSAPTAKPNAVDLGKLL